MKRLDARGLTIFILAGLALCATLVLVVAPHASTSPDGLERVAQDKGFEGKAQEVWTSSPAKGYNTWAGLAGTATIFLLAWGLALVLRKKNGRVAPDDTVTTDSGGG